MQRRGGLQSAFSELAGLISRREPAAGAPSAQSDVEALTSAIADRLNYSVGVSQQEASSRDWLEAISFAIRDSVTDRWLATRQEAAITGGKEVCYLSLEFLIGRLLRDSADNVGLLAALKESLAKLGAGDFDAIAALEADPALGNGGLGRLAACYMESMASVGVPAFGYGIRYDHGLFRQIFQDGRQIEEPDSWCDNGNPWEIVPHRLVYSIGFGGTAEDKAGVRWQPAEIIEATAFDTPVPGWRGNRVNTLRLWRARAVHPLRLDQFNGGDHIGAQFDEARAESINKVLYPSDANPAGQELRLRQEYFFTAASLRDLITRHMARHNTIETLPDKVAIQLNDTHPSIAVAELMRLLMDEHNLPEERAWAVTRATISYTNHTLLPEALESWPVRLMTALLPRHMQIIYALDARIAADVPAKAGTDTGMASRVSLIDRNGDWRVRMGNLAFAGSHKVNGVSQLHTDLMKDSVFSDLDRLYPGRIVNKTNGVTPRRWLLGVNPGLTSLIRQAIGDRFLADLGEIEKLKPLASDPAFKEKFAAIKRANKDQLAARVNATLGVEIDPSALFDVQIKRIHEYKRQFLNLLQTVALYDAMRDRPTAGWTPVVKIFAGKAAPSYYAAKQIIHLINDVAAVINADASLRGLLKIAFLPNYNVSLAEIIVPAADLSEQISTAGMEASGTGNMKLALNGALTIGTLDGANVEMRERIGAQDMVIFGLTAAQVTALRKSGHDPRANIERSAPLKRALEEIGSGRFTGGDRDRYRGLIDGLYQHDWFMLTADFDAYAAAQRDVAVRWADQPAWQRSAILNTAGVGWFSSDRAVRQYAADIWNIPTT